MSNVEELAILPANEITTENVHFDEETSTYQFDDAAALKLVLDDTQTADGFMNINQWPAAWSLATTLYQSPTASSAFDGGNVTQANVPKFVVSNHISSIVPRLMGGIFYENPPFQLNPFPGTTKEVVDWKTAVFSAQLNLMEFENECERALDQMALLGTCIMKWGYTEYKKKVKNYVREKARAVAVSPMGDAKVDTIDSDKFKIVHESETVSHPWIKYCDIRTVMVDPGTRIGDIRKAKWVVYREFATYQDLEQLRGVEGYDIPDETTLRSFFLNGPGGAPGGQPTTGHDNITLTLPEGMRGWIQSAVPRNYKTSADPLQNGLMILERWDNEKVIVVLNCNSHNILIRNEPNPYGKIPFLSANWRNIGDAFYGQGLGLLIGAEQLVEQGITNLALDLLAYGLQPTAVRKKGFNVTTQNTRWKQGGIIDVDEDVDKAFKFLQMPPIPTDAWTAIQQSKSDSAATSGANEQVMQGAGSSGARATGMRSGTGAAAVIQANASRLDGPDGRFIRQIFVPWLYIMDELNNDYLPASVMRQVLGDKLGEQVIQSFDHIKYRNAKLEFQVLAGAKLGPRKEMSQAMPIIMQLMANPTFAESCKQAGWKFDGPAIFKAFTEVNGWSFSQPFLKEMTQEEKDFVKANSPAALQAQQLQTQKQVELAKFEQDRVLEDQKQMGKAGNQVLRQAMASEMEDVMTPKAE